MKKVLLQGRQICKSFSGVEESRLILNQIDIELYENDFTVVMGASGAGKSTLLYCLSGMDSITKGGVFYKDKEISRFSEKQMAKLRAKEFGFVFQQTHLVSNLTLFENVAVAGYVGSTETEKETKKRAEKLLQKMNIGGAKKPSARFSFRW